MLNRNLRQADMFKNVIIFVSKRLMKKCVQHFKNLLILVSSP